MLSEEAAFVGVWTMVEGLQLEKGEKSISGKNILCKDWRHERTVGLEGLHGKAGGGDRRSLVQCIPFFGG